MAYPQHLDILPSSLSQCMVYYLVKNKGNFEALMQLQKLGKILVGGWEPYHTHTNRLNFQILT